MSSIASVGPESFDGAALAASANLQKVGTRPKLGRYLADSWQRRSFALTLSRFNLQASTAKSSLGVAWLVLVPALQISIYGIIFGVVLGSVRPANFLPYLITGIVLFQFVSGCFTDGAKAITANASLVRSLDFPRILLPLSSVVANVIKVGPLVVLMLLGVIGFGEVPNWGWFLLIPALLLMTLFAAGLSMIAARLTVHFQDLNQLLPFLVRVLFYTSGIFYTVDRLAGGLHWAQLLLHNNPFHIYLTLARGVLVSGYSASTTDWIVGIAWAFATLIIGTVFFWQAEERYGRNV